MKNPEFVDGIDRETFFPFVLRDNRASTGDVRLIFANWDWIDKVVGDDSLEGYDLNGYGVEGIVKAVRLQAGLGSQESGAIQYSSEGDTCFIRFSSLKDACLTAELAQAAFQDISNLRSLVIIAQEKGFGE